MTDTPPPTTPGSIPPGHSAASGADLTVHAFQKLIRDRYYATDSARGETGTFVLLMEEVGELATAIHNNRRDRSRPPTSEERDNLVEEFADVLAWIATLANIFEVDLADALSKYTEPGRVEGVKD